MNRNELLNILHYFELWIEPPKILSKERRKLDMRKKDLLIAILLLFAFNINAAKAEPNKILIIEADEWCPINCAIGKGPEGIGIDIARKIYEPLGYTIVYTVVPWTQALSDMRSGKADAIVGAGAQDDASLIFPSNYLFDISDDFYVMAENPWIYQGPSTLRDKRIGIVIGYGYGEVITQFIKDNMTRGDLIQSVSGNDALDQNIEKLRNGKIDILIESKPVMDYTLKKKWETGIVWKGGIEQAPVYLAFSPANPSAHFFVTQYDAGIQRLKKSGELSAIYKAYGLQP